MDVVHFASGVGAILVCLIGYGLGRRFFGRAVNPISLWALSWPVSLAAASLVTLPDVPPIQPATLFSAWMGTLALLGGALAAVVIRARPDGLVRSGPTLAKGEDHRYRLAARGAAILGLLGILLTAREIGGLPAISPGGELLRTAFKDSRFHLIFNLGKVAILLYSIAAYAPPHGTGFRRQPLVDRALLWLTVIANLTTGTRGDAGIAFAFLILPAALLRPGLVTGRRVIISIVVGLLIFYTVWLQRQYSRDIAALGLSGGPRLLLSSMSDVKFWLEPLYYLVPNYAIYQNVLLHFQGQTYGFYTFDQLLLIPGMREYADAVTRGALVTFDQEFGSIEIGGYNQPVYLTWLFIDFGPWGVIIGSVLLGYFAVMAYTRVMRAPRVSPFVFTLNTLLLLTLVMLPVGPLFSSGAFLYWPLYVVLALATLRLAKRIVRRPAEEPFRLSLRGEDERG